MTKLVPKPVPAGNLPPLGPSMVQVPVDSVSPDAKPLEEPNPPKILAASARSLAKDCGSFADHLDPQVKPPDKDDASLTKLIVAVHGIGDQFRFATIQSVVHRLITLCDTPVPYPLGKFHAAGDEVRATPFEIPKAADKAKEEKARKLTKKQALERQKEEERAKKLKKFVGLGFAEVFWADIHQAAQKTGDTIEESKAWAQTMVDRMQALDRMASSSTEGGIPGANKESVDYKKTAAVVKEMIETIATLENLCLVAEKMGLGKFELRSLLDDYLGAVQLVAEFKDYGGRIFEQFAKIMRALVEKHQNVKEIYIVAHSEGTVVSFYSLLAALSVRGGPDEKWVKMVRGYMTIGSPIDKHIVMWPDLWKGFRENWVDRTAETGEIVDDEKLRVGNERRQPWKEVGVEMPKPIVWWNYYDNGDPVGFILDSTRLWLQDHLWVTVVDGTGDNTGKRVLAEKQPFFDFPPEHDVGFTRYYLPGKAHNDYWEDDGVFGHFIDTVMEPTTAHAEPESEFWPRIVSWVVPYLLCLLLLAGGIYLIYSAIDPLLKPEPANAFLEDSVRNLQASAANTSNLATNIAQAVAEKAEAPPDNIPVSVPIPMDKADAGKNDGNQEDSIGRTLMNVFALTFLLAGITVASRIPRLVKSEYWNLVSVAVFLVGVFSYHFGASDRVRDNLAQSLRWLHLPGDSGIIILAVVIAVVSSRISRSKPDWGMKPLMGLAGLTTLVIIFGLMTWKNWGGKDSSTWPLVLAGAAFIYLWWLAALIFDLTFVWHRYIRLNTTPNLLMGIREKRREESAKNYAASRIPAGSKRASF